MIDRGSLWSFLRAVMMQGQDIAHDYKNKGYEEMSARLDAAAGERADQWLKMTSNDGEVKG